MISSEWNLIKEIELFLKQNEIKPTSALKMSIGDDCAIIEPTKNKLSLHSTDISIEDVHFIINKNEPENIGFKAMNGNISDIVAMGGKPLIALIALGIPDHISKNFILKLYKGFIEATNKSNMNIVGGDISKSKVLTISISIYGEVFPENIVKRDGAKIGDKIYVTGDIGRSKVGLDLLISSKDKITLENNEILEKHLRPESSLKIIDKINETYKPTSMIDISDGFLSDLNHICNKSSCGYTININNIPIHEKLKQYYKNDIDYESILSSGEEYELIFTSNEKNIPEVISFNDKKITQIGTITDNQKILLYNNKKIEINKSGYNHFEENKC